MPSTVVPSYAPTAEPKGLGEESLVHQHVTRPEVHSSSQNSRLVSHGPLNVFDALPSEILHTIFQAYMRRPGEAHHRVNTTPQTLPESKRHRRKLVLLTHICHAWRVYATNDPSLWTDIRVYDSSRIYSLFFSRSAPLPIDITIDLSAANADGPIRAVADMLKEELSRKPQRGACPCLDRIRSIHITSDTPEGEFGGAAIAQSLFERCNLPILQRLSVRSMVTSYLQGVHSAFQPGLLRPTLTKLELYHRCDNLGMNGLRAIFTTCPALETLVLGPAELCLDEDSDEDPDESFKQSELRACNPPIHAPALRHLALGAGIFAWNRERICAPGCPCIVGNLVASNLHYLEVTGDDQFYDTLRHVTPLINRRAELDQHDPSRTLTVVLNSNASELSQPDQPSLLQMHTNIHLHLVHAPEATALISRGQPTMITSWLTRPNSTTLYLGKGSLLEELNNIAQLEPRRGVVPVLVHPKEGNPFLASREEKPWILSDDNPGPYHDANALDDSRWRDHSP